MNNMNKKVYFAGSIRGGRVDASLYQRMIDYIKQTETVLTEHIGKTNILRFTLSRQKRQSRCGMLSHVAVSVRSMMMVVLGLFVSVENIRPSIADMRRWRIGWVWKTLTTTGMRDLTENGRKTCTLYILFTIYMTIATSHCTTLYMSVSPTWRCMWSLMIW